MGKIIGKNDEVIEIIVNDNRIGKLAEKLKEFSNTKQHIYFNIDNNNELLMHHSEDEFP